MKVQALKECGGGGGVAERVPELHTQSISLALCTLPRKFMGMRSRLSLQWESRDQECCWRAGMLLRRDVLGRVCNANASECGCASGIGTDEMAPKESHCSPPSDKHEFGKWACTGKPASVLRCPTLRHMPQRGRMCCHCDVGACAVTAMPPDDIHIRAAAQPVITVICAHWKPGGEMY